MSHLCLVAVFFLSSSSLSLRLLEKLCMLLRLVMIVGKSPLMIRQFSLEHRLMESVSFSFAHPQTVDGVKFINFILWNGSESMEG